MGKKNLISSWIFMFFLAFFVLISYGRFGGDGLENYLTAESIVLDGDFSIHDRPFDVKEMRYAARGRMDADGKRYSTYGLGLAFLLVPFYCLGHIFSDFIGSVPHGYVTQFTVSFFNPMVLALLSVVLFKLLLRLGYNAKISFFTSLIYSLCSMNVVYARSGFAEPAIALLILLAALSMFDYSRDGKTLPVVLAAVSIGYMLFIKKNSFILLPGFALYFFYLLSKDKKRSLGDKVRHFACFAGPIVLSVFAILLQNKVLYGGITSTEYGTVGDLLSKITTDGYPVKGLYYYLISSGKGYFIYNIAMVLGLFALRDFYRKHRDYCIFIAALLLSNLLFYSFIFLRGSLFSWGPRYLFPTLPLLALFLAEFMSGKDTVKRKVTVAFFAAVGFIIQLPNLVVSFSKYLFFVKEKLGLEEFLINFMPELSPVKGVWMLLLSFMNRFLRGVSLNFSYNPDLWFFETVRVSLEGYDIADIWWVNVIKIDPSLKIPVCAALGLLLILLMSSCRKIIIYLKRC